DSYFEQKKEKAKQIYNSKRVILSPYFKQDIILNSDGFHHLRYSARRERNKKEQLLKFTLLPLALKIIKEAATLQEYRKLLCPIGEKSHRDGSVPMKTVEWWGFIAIFIKHEIKVRVVLRRIGDGNIHFWSVMPYSKLQKGKRQKLFTDGLDDD
ncbi:MAG: hypothetical protein NTW60_01145, partial [Candidatus Wolfebacteria bacterium]|nr:hypothetical protein [Candidatus Wolfebacteria bacterium]